MAAGVPLVCRDVDVDDAAFDIGWNDSAGGPLAAQLRAEAAQVVTLYLVEVQVPGGHAC